MFWRTCREHRLFIVGLTGSIGMGKSETAKMFRRLGVPVFDADAAVHDLLKKHGCAVRPVELAFPGVTKDGAVNRPTLGARVFGKRQELRRLEAILHPMVGRAQRAFLATAQSRRLPLVVLDIPLLFEGRGEERCDATAVASAPKFIQRQRVLARRDMTAEKFENIRRQQVPDSVKRQRADFLLPTGLGRRHTLDLVTQLIHAVQERPGHAWPPNSRPRRRPNNHPSRRPVHARNRIRY